MKLALPKGATSVTINVFIQNSSSTTGAGLTGLVFNSAGLTAHYIRERAAAAAITLATQTVTGAYSSGGFVEIDATNMPGWYRFDVPDAVLASGVNSVGLLLKGATNMAPLPIELQLTDVNLNDAVRAGLTALPNVASGSAGAIPTTGTGANQINVAGGRADSNVTYFGGAAGTFAGGRPEVNSSHISGDQTTADRLEQWVDSWDSGTAQAGAAGSITLAAGASAVTDFFKGAWIFISAGTGAGQGRKITAYNGTSKVATISPNWATNPDATSVYALIPEGLSIVDTSSPIPADVRQFGGVAGTFAGGRPEVNTTHAAGTAWNSGAIGAATIANDAIAAAKIATGAITSTKFAAGAIDAAAIATDAIAATKIAAAALNGKGDWNIGKTGYSVAAGGINRAAFAADTGLQTIRSATAQAGAVGTITLDASASAVDDFYIDCLIYITGGTGAGQSRYITDYVGATKVASVRPNWATAPDNTSTFAVIVAASVFDQVMADHVDSGSTGASLNAAGSAGDPWTTALPGAYGAGTAGNIIGNNLNAAVSTRSTLDAAGVRTAVGMASANLDTQITNIPTNVWSHVVEGSMTAVQAMRGMFAALLNKLSGAATTTVTIRDQADTKNRVTATVDSSGNRTAVTTDLT